MDAGRIALVTGASSGIGRAITLALIRDGARVIGLARGVERLQALADEVGSDALVTMRVDVTEEPAVKAALAEIGERFGGLDIVVANAGRGLAGSLLDGRSETWRSVVDTNFLSVAILLREAIPLLRARGDRGHIVVIASLSAHRVAPLGNKMY